MGFNTVFDESRIDTKLFSDVTDDLVNANNQSVIGLIRLDLPNLSHTVHLFPLFGDFGGDCTGSVHPIQRFI